MCISGQYGYPKYPCSEKKMSTKNLTLVMEREVKNSFFICQWPPDYFYGVKYYPLTPKRNFSIFFLIFYLQNFHLWLNLLKNDYISNHVKIGGQERNKYLWKCPSALVHRAQNLWQIFPNSFLKFWKENHKNYILYFNKFLSWRVSHAYFWMFEFSQNSWKKIGIKGVIIGSFSV